MPVSTRNSCLHALESKTKAILQKQVDMIGFVVKQWSALVFQQLDSLACIPSEYE